VENTDGEARSFIYNYFTEKGRPQKSLENQWKSSVCKQKPVINIQKLLEAVEINDWCWQIPKWAFQKVSLVSNLRMIKSFFMKIILRTKNN